MPATSRLPTITTDRIYITTGTLWTCVPPDAPVQAIDLPEATSRMKIRT